ncbi:hypothetical protein [Candidatus Nitrosotenuis aquarius]|uniref:hypothetical protein n=1 Tax=Candidatus Nitrosotenuis aquarius TaxID=1846278 RepID=UPI000C1DEC0E|nr:hypothetical protein [Candidatus Nitrosotenuis aquarius]
MVFRIILGSVLTGVGGFLLLTTMWAGMPAMGEAPIIPSPIEFGEKLLDIGIKATIFAVGAMILGSGVRARSSYAYP